MSELYALPEGWKWKKLGDIVKIIGGGTPSKKVPEYWNNGTIKWATVGDMNVDMIVDTELSITEKGLKESSSNIVPKEAIVIATRVGLGKVCYLETDTAINQDLKGLLPVNKELNIRFLYNFFKYIEKDIVNNGTGATVKGVKLDFVKSIRVPLPPLQEQKRIVAKLDSLFAKIDQAIALHQQNIDEADALMGSVLDEVFGELEGKYGLRKINTLFKIKSGDFLPKKKMNINGTINVYGGNGINGRHDRFNLMGENIIIGRVGALCGNVHYVDEKIWLTDNAFYVSEYYEDMDKQFLTYMLRHIKLGSSANQAAQPVISYKSISNMKFPLPPLKT